MCPGRALLPCSWALLCITMLCPSLPSWGNHLVLLTMVQVTSWPRAETELMLSLRTPVYHCNKHGTALNFRLFAVLGCFLPPCSSCTSSGLWWYQICPPRS